MVDPEKVVIETKAPAPAKIAVGLTVVLAVAAAAAGMLGFGQHALGGIVVSAFFWIVVHRRPRWRTLGFTVVVVLLAVATALAVRTHWRYRAADQMEIPVSAFSNADYPEDPAHRGTRHGQYNGRRLSLIKKDETHFDFVFEPLHPHVARIVFKNVDVSLMTVNPPLWTRDDPGLLRIALTDREWNRQQVSFGGLDSPNVEISGGDGWERSHLLSAELARNCLNAGLWELLLFTEEDGKKSLYAQGWFTFPLGHYKHLFEHNTSLPYARHWHYLEHWFDPAGTAIPLDKLRTVVAERRVPARFDTSEGVVTSGEQARKRRTTIAENVVAWKDLYDGRSVRFATFIPPGRYSVDHPWGNQYHRIERFDHAVLREIRSPAGTRPLHELEVVFSGSGAVGACRFIISGIDLERLPTLAVPDYPKGLYMPMGIGVPPFFQSYDDLRKSPPERGPFFSVLLDDKDRWIDHHKLALDGPVLHKDADDSRLLHLYLLSYERHSLIGHVVVTIGK